MQDARLNELKMPSIAADAAEARCLIEEHFKVHIKLLRQDKGGVPIVLSTDFSIDFPLAWQC